MKSFFWVLLIAFSQNTRAEGLIKSLAFGYCNITHPVEMLNNIRHDNTCEEQHIIQQQHGGEDNGNISIVPVSSHITTDTWGGNGIPFQGNVWANSPEDDGWGNTNNAEDSLAQAYKLGRWQQEFTFILFDYNNDEWHLTLTQWNGMSHLTYLVSWWVNTPSKFLRKTSYLLDKQRYSLLIDQAIQIPVIVFEGAIGTIYSITGMVIGTILHPIDTACAIIGGLVLIFESLFMGFIDFFLTIFLAIKSIL